MSTLTHAGHPHNSVMSQSESCTDVWDWLCVLRLEQYSNAFQSAGLASLRQCRKLTQDQLEQMGITLPGHQRRIMASLNKTHGSHDTHSHFEQSEKSEEMGQADILWKERPVPTPGEEKPEKKQGESLRPIPREREKPVPKERQAYRPQENTKEEDEKKPFPGQKQTEPRREKDEESNGGLDGDRGKPVPKERTKFRSSAPADCSFCSFGSPSSDTSLPPVPPRSMPNCPPQRFTSSMCSLPPAQTPASPKADNHAVIAPTVQPRSVSSSSTRVPTYTPVHSPNLSSTQTRPQTLAIQLPAQHLEVDRGRKTSPISPNTSPINERNAPPLPPKAGTGPKGPPTVPRRILAQTAKTHRYGSF